MEQKKNYLKMFIIYKDVDFVWLPLLFDSYVPKIDTALPVILQSKHEKKTQEVAAEILL